jgi:hypothetical protein
MLLLVLFLHYTQMGARIKAGASIDISHLQQLSSRRRWSFTIAAAGTASLALGALMGTWGIQNLKAAIANRSAAEPGILQLSYRRYIIVFAARIKHFPFIAYTVYVCIEIGPVLMSILHQAVLCEACAQHCLVAAWLLRTQRCNSLVCSNH